MIEIPQDQPPMIGLGVSGRNLNETILNSFRLLDQNGTKRPSRNGPMTCLYDLTLTNQDPRARHLSLAGRTSNIYQMIAETFWVMSGANAIDPYLSFFLPRAKNYSDDGQTWTGAYGPRLYALNQMEDAIQAFVDEGQDTRRSVIQIADVYQDTRLAFAERFGPDAGPQKDVPCNREIHLFMTPGLTAPRLNMKLIQRSGDSIFGAGSINPFEFSFLQEVFLGFLEHAMTKEQLPTGVDLGHYIWNVTNYHVYDFTRAQMDDVLRAESNAMLVSQNANALRIKAPTTPEAFRAFMAALVSDFSYLINELSHGVLQLNVYEEESNLRSTFHDAGLPSDGNMLYYYARHVLFYIFSKLGAAEGMPLEMDDDEIQATDFMNAISTSSFRRYETKRAQE